MYLQVLRIPLLQVYHRRYQHLFHKPIVSGHLCNLGLLLPKGNHALGLLDNRVQLYFLLVVVFNHTIGIFHWPGRCIYLRTIVNGRGCGDQRLFLNNCGNLFVLCCPQPSKGKISRRVHDWVNFGCSVVVARVVNVRGCIQTENSEIQPEICWCLLNNVTVCHGGDVCPIDLLPNVRKLRNEMQRLHIPRSLRPVQIYPAHICLGLPLLNSHQTIFVDCHSGLVCSIRLWVIFHFTNPRILDLGNYVSRTKTRRLFQIKQCCQHEHTNPNTKTHHPITGQARRRPRWRPRRTQLVKIEIYNHIAWGNNFICHYRRNPSRQRGLHLGRFPHKPQILGTNGFCIGSKYHRVP